MKIESEHGRGPSIFLLSLPRSLSCRLYHSIRRALKFQEPTWTSDGEILNADRFVFLPAQQHDLGRKFTTEATQPEEFHRMMNFLDEIIQPRGYVYKDVIQPFVMAEWLLENRFPVLKVKRPIADVAYSMMNRDWYYPGSAFPETKHSEIALLKGLMAASKSIDSVPGQTIDFDMLIFDEEHVRQALLPFRPRLRPNSVKYIDPEFEESRNEILARRKTPKYAFIVKMLRRLQKELQTC